MAALTQGRGVGAEQVGVLSEGMLKSKLTATLKSNGILDSLKV